MMTQEEQEQKRLIIIITILSIIIILLFFVGIGLMVFFRHDTSNIFFIMGWIFLIISFISMFLLISMVF